MRVFNVRAYDVTLIRILRIAINFSTVNKHVKMHC